MRRRALRLLIGGAVVLLAACTWARGPACNASTRSESCTRVLFIGNSYTSVNDLPARFKAIAAVRRHAVYTEMIAPVGDAWALVVAERPDIPLWQGDGSHPTEQGTFLAANVLVAALFHDVPQGLGTRGGIPEGQVFSLQTAAARAALGEGRRPTP